MIGVQWSSCIEERVGKDWGGVQTRGDCVSIDGCSRSRGGEAASLHLGTSSERGAVVASAAGKMDMNKQGVVHLWKEVDMASSWA